MPNLSNRQGTGGPASLAGLPTSQEDSQVRPLRARHTLPGRSPCPSPLGGPGPDPEPCSVSTTPIAGRSCGGYASGDILEALLPKARLKTSAPRVVCAVCKSPCGWRPVTVEKASMSALVLESRALGGKLSDFGQVSLGWGGGGPLASQGGEFAPLPPWKEVRAVLVFQTPINSPGHWEFIWGGWKRLGSWQMTHVLNTFPKERTFPRRGHSQGESSFREWAAGVGDRLSELPRMDSLCVFT